MMSDMPERIWLTDRDVAETVDGIGTEYRRADLPPTLKQAMMVPEVRELVETLKIIERHGYLPRGPGHTAQTTARAALRKINEVME